MKHETRPQLRLLALNLAILLLCTLALPFPALAAKSGSIDLGYGTRNQGGSGWNYSASSKALTLDGYQGGQIRVTGDLVLIGNDKPGKEGSNVSLTLRSDYAAYQTYNTGTHIEKSSSGSSVSSAPKTYTATINANEGTIDGRAPVTRSSPYPTHMKLREVTPSGRAMS